MRISTQAAGSGAGSGFLLFRPLQHHLAVRHFHQDGIALVERAGEQGIRERILDLLLDDAAQRAGTHLGVVTRLGQQVQRAARWRSA